MRLCYGNTRYIYIYINCSTSRNLPWMIIALKLMTTNFQEVTILNVLKKTVINNNFVFK